jgi:hypothetical protein
VLPHEHTSNMKDDDLACILSILATIAGIGTQEVLQGKRRAPNVCTSIVR